MTDAHVPDPPEPDLVTVVVPARDEEAFIGTCLASVQNQDYRNLQIIVVDGASRDRTRAIVLERARHDDRICLLDNPERIIPRSLNLALAAARGRWLVRVDAHASVPPEYVRRAVAHLRTGQWSGVGGRKDGAGVTPAGRAIAAAMASRFGVGNSTYHYGEQLRTVEHIPFGAYPVELARRLGGWNEELAVNQDFELDYRIRAAGGLLLFDPALVINWHCRQSVRDLYRQYRRYGKGKAVVGRLHPASLRVRHFMAPALTATAATALVIGTRHPLRAAAMLAPYAVALTAASVGTARSLRSRDERLWVAPAFAAMHLGWGIGFWEGVARMVLPVGRAGGAR